MWLKAKDINRAIDKAANLIVGKIDLKDLKEQIIQGILVGYGERLIYDYQHEVFLDVRKALVKMVIDNQKEKILAEISNSDFTELVRQGIKERIKVSV